MSTEVAAHWLADAIAQFRQYKEMADKAIAQVPDSGLHGLLDDDANSIAIIMRHVAGNQRSRWTDLFTSDGEKPDRDRDGEFVLDASTPRGLILDEWERGWALLFRVLGSLTVEDLMREVRVRDQPLTVVMAINRQLTHYASHVGQIITLSRHYRGDAWRTLSIPRRREV